MTDLEEIGNSLAIYFKKEPHKITLWLFTENLNFGGSSPAQLILAGRIKRVRDFIEYALLENEFSTVTGKKFKGPELLIDALKKIAYEDNVNSNFSRSEEECQYYIDLAKNALKEWGGREEST